jgi:Fe-S-cluster containining protein
MDRACRYLDGRNPTARCSIYADRPAACREYISLWREGVGEVQDRPDKSGIIAHLDSLDNGSVQLVVTLDDERGSEVDDALTRVQEWAADKPIDQIFYRFSGTKQAAIQSRDGTIIKASFVTTDYENIRFLHPPNVLERSGDG